MGGPPGGLKASVEHMRIAADNWSSGAGRLEEASTGSADMSTTFLEMGLFQITWSKYEGAVQYLHDRLQEGATEFENVARALHTCADAYENVDVGFANSINQMQQPSEAR